MSHAERYSLAENLAAYESGALDSDAQLNLFGYLIRTGLAWTLQGSYGRAAMDLIRSGAVLADGTVVGVDDDRITLADLSDRLTHSLPQEPES